MKTWFIKDNPECYCRRWFTSYYAISEYGGHITDDYTLHQAIFMAHDLLACHYYCLARYPEDSPSPILDDTAMKQRIEEYFPGLSILGTMDIDVDLTKGGWVRKGDLPPATHQHFRTRQYRKAFALAYRNVTFEEN